jgi:hypothetical protein
MMSGRALEELKEQSRSVAIALVGRHVRAFALAGCGEKRHPGEGFSHVRIPIAACKSYRRGLEKLTSQQTRCRIDRRTRAGSGQNQREPKDSPAAAGNHAKTRGGSTAFVREGVSERNFCHLPQRGAGQRCVALPGHCA